MTAGLVVVDKAAGMTSHDVVGCCRRIFGTRKVGHAGTLDPMATGVLVVGIERATKILGLLTATDKSYAATIRLGQSTSTDDAEGEVLQTVSADGVTDAEIDDAVARSLPRARGVDPLHPVGGGPGLERVRAREFSACAVSRAGENQTDQPRPRKRITEESA